MIKIKNLLESMDYNELKILNSDLKKGQFDFNNIVRQTLKSKEKEHSKYCSVCGNDLIPSNNNYSIMFGPEDFKKRASFCALDCMEYFMLKLKNIKNGKVENNQEKEIEN